jgi:hypothetical protein
MAYPRHGDPILPTRKPSIDQELIDDQKFLEKIERKRYFDRIVREANEAAQCPGCGGWDWRMQPKYWVEWVANSLVAVMVCRRCKRKILFETQIERDYPDEEEEEDSEELPFRMFGNRF